MSVEITFVGDIAFFPNNFEKSKNSFDINEYKILRESNILIGNLEFPFSLVKKPYLESSHLEYLAPLESIDILKQIGFNALTLGNNHILDWGLEGINTTKSILKKNNIKSFGVGFEEKDSRLPLILESDRIKFGFLNYCKKGNFSSYNNNPGAALLDEKKIIEDIDKLKNKVNHIILILHWGVEFSEYPFPDDVTIAHKLIDNGVSCIIGHHPHVVQGLEIYDRKPIFYSLGSFIYNPFYERIFVKNKLEERLISIAVKLKFSFNSVLSWEIIPYKNSGKTIFPYKMNEKEELVFYEKFNLISKRINEKKWFYNQAASNLLKRELHTIIKLIIDSKGKYIFKLIKMLKLRHLKILLGKFI